MNKIYFTQKYPFLLPFRKAQRKICFYTKMRFDGQRYASTLSGSALPAAVFQSKTGLVNPNTGFSMAYQENKAFNIGLAAKTLNGLTICPGETFSFWQRVKLAEKNAAFKDGLSLVNGEITPTPGGGLCQLASFLLWLFLHTPLTICELHPHDQSCFLSANEGIPKGIDAAVSEGWLDLKVKNNTSFPFQIRLQVQGGKTLSGSILCGESLPFVYEAGVKNRLVIEKGGKTVLQSQIFRRELEKAGGAVLFEECVQLTCETAGGETEDKTVPRQKPVQRAAVL